MGANEYTHIEYIATSIFIITPANRSGIFPDFSYLPRAGDWIDRFGQTNVDFDDEL